MALFMTNITPEILKTLEGRIAMGGLKYNNPDQMGGSHLHGMTKWLYQKQSFVRLISNAKIKTDEIVKQYTVNDISKMTKSEQLSLYESAKKFDDVRFNKVGQSAEVVEYTYDPEIRKNWVLTGGTINNSIKNQLDVNTPEAKLADFRSGYGELYSNVRNVPFPGITDVTVKNKNAFGSVREAEIKYVCHCIEHLEMLELLYMTPGVSCFLEWGWSLLPNGEWNYEQMSSDDMTRFDSCVIADVIQRVKNTGGHYDGMKGLITDFNWTMNSNGGFDCSTTLVSMADTFLSADSKSTSRGLKGSPIEVDRESIKTGEKSIPCTNINWVIEKLFGLSALKELSEMTNTDVNNKSTAYLKIKDKLIYLYDIPVAFFYDINQDSNGVFDGIKHWFDSSKTEMYVTWGFIEDFILTNNLGFLKDEGDSCGIVNNELILKCINGTFPSGSSPANITDDDVYETNKSSGNDIQSQLSSNIVTGAVKSPEVFKPIFPKFNSYATKIFNTAALASADPLICVLPGQLGMNVNQVGFGGPIEPRILSEQEQSSLNNQSVQNNSPEMEAIQRTAKSSTTTPNTVVKTSQTDEPDEIDKMIQTELAENNKKFAANDATGQQSDKQRTVSQMGVDAYLASILLPADCPQFAANINRTKGYVRNIGVNINFLKKVYDDTDTIDTFVMGLLNGISDACGQAWKFGLFVDEDNSSVISVVDLNEWKEEEPIVPTIPCYGTNSICREVSITTELDANMKGQIMFGTNQKKNAKDISTKGTQGYQFFGRLVKDITLDNVRQSDLSGFPGDTDDANKVDMSPEGIIVALNDAMSELANERNEETVDAAKTAINNYLVHVVKCGHEPLGGKINGVVLPLKLIFTIDGLSGLKFGNMLKVEPLPPRYDNLAYFTITNIEHSLSGNDWQTKIDTVMRIQIDPNMKEIDTPGLTTPQGASNYSGGNYASGASTLVKSDFKLGNNASIIGKFKNPIKGIYSADYKNKTGNGYLSSTVNPKRVITINGQTKSSPHKGVDIICNLRAPVYAAADGIVNVIGYEAKGAGHYIEISHSTINANKIYITRYMHLDSPPVVNDNANVTKGQLIGYAGTSGGSTGVHLHFEIRESNGLVYDPAKVITDIGVA